MSLKWRLHGRALLGRFSRLFKEKFRKVLKKFKKVRVRG
jgi:hypothetical protein